MDEPKKHKLEETRWDDSSGGRPQQYLQKTRTDLSGSGLLETATDITSFAEASQLPGVLTEHAPDAQRFELLTEVGKGATGSIYAMRDHSLERTIAVKFLPRSAQQHASVQNKFMHEAQVTAGLEHPNIMPVYDIGATKDGRLFFAMKKIEGCSLGDAIRTTKAKQEPPEEFRTVDGRVRIFLKVCDALAYAHFRGCVHQDVKPDNIMLGRFGEVLLLDWGSALRKDKPEQGIGLKFLGTPAYMSPEQARRESVDERSDVYSLGASLYQALTLKHPTWADDPEAFWAKKRRGEIDPLTDRERRAVPAALLDIALKAMAADPAGRYASVEELAADLKRYQARQRVLAHRESALETAGRLYRKHQRVILTASSLLAVVAGVSSLLFREKIKEMMTWTLYHAEDFSKLTTARLGGDWRMYRSRNWWNVDTVTADSGSWTVQNGALVGKSVWGFENLTFNREIPGDIRVEWEATPLLRTIFLAMVLPAYEFQRGLGETNLADSLADTAALRRLWNELPRLYGWGKSFGLDLAPVAFFYNTLMLLTNLYPDSTGPLFARYPEFRDAKADHMIDFGFNHQALDSFSAVTTVLGEAAYGMGLYQDVIGTYNRARREVAAALIQLGHYGQVIDHFADQPDFRAQALRLAGRFDELLKYRDLAVSSTNLSEAVIAAQDLGRLDEYVATAGLDYQALAKVLTGSLGRPDSALAVLAAHSGSRDLFHNLLHQSSLVEMGRFDEAFDAGIGALALQAPTGELLVAMGERHRLARVLPRLKTAAFLYHAEAGDYDSALQAVRGADNNLTLTALMHAGRFDEIRRDFGRWRNLMAWLLLHERRYDECAAGYPEQRFIAAEALLRAGRYDELFAPLPGHAFCLCTRALPNRPGRRGADALPGVAADVCRPADTHGRVRFRHHALSRPACALRTCLRPGQALRRHPIPHRDVAGLKRRLHRSSAYRGHAAVGRRRPPGRPAGRGAAARVFEFRGRQDDHAVRRVPAAAGTRGACGRHGVHGAAVPADCRRTCGPDERVPAPRGALPCRRHRRLRVSCTALRLRRAGPVPFLQGAAARSRRTRLRGPCRLSRHARRVRPPVSRQSVCRTEPPASRKQRGAAVCRVADRRVVRGEVTGGFPPAAASPCKDE